MAAVAAGVAVAAAAGSRATGARGRLVRRWRTVCSYRLRLSLSRRRRRGRFPQGMRLRPAPMAAAAAVAAGRRATNTRDHPVGERYAQVRTEGSRSLSPQFRGAIFQPTGGSTTPPPLSHQSISRRAPSPPRLLLLVVVLTRAAASSCACRPQVALVARKLRPSPSSYACCPRVARVTELGENECHRAQGAPVHVERPIGVGRHEHRREALTLAEINLTLRAITRAFTASVTSYSWSSLDLNSARLPHVARVAELVEDERRVTVAGPNRSNHAV